MSCHDLRLETEYKTFSGLLWEIAVSVMIKLIMLSDKQEEGQVFGASS